VLLNGTAGEVFEWFPVVQRMVERYVNKLEKASSRKKRQRIYRVIILSLSLLGGQHSIVCDRQQGKDGWI
jgi:hypothetical protein